jgi:NitT/TauT family transport system substrate-binding protein
MSAAAAEPRLETTRLALARDPTICPAPMYVAEQILKTEGFTEVRYVPMAADQNIPQLLSSGKADISTDTVPILLLGLEAGDAIVLWADCVGCYEIFTTPNVKTMRDLGQDVAISQEHDDAMPSGRDAYPRRPRPHWDIRWVTHPAEESMRLLAAGDRRVPRLPPERRGCGVGHVLLTPGQIAPDKSTCCMLVGNHRSYARTRWRPLRRAPSSRRRHLGARSASRGSWTAGTSPATTTPCRPSRNALRPVARLR